VVTRYVVVRLRGSGDDPSKRVSEAMHVWQLDVHRVRVARAGGGVTSADVAARKVKTAQALLKRMTTPEGKSAAHDAILSAMVDFWREARRLHGANVWRDSETRRVANSK
jgi:hypothetical protein